MTARFFALPHETKAQDAAAARAPMPAGNTRARCGPRPAPPTTRKAIRSRRRAWRSSGRRQRVAGLQGGDARLRARQLGARHEGAVLLRAEARLHAGLLHRGARSALARLPEHAAASALPADDRRQARGLHRLARRRAYRFRLSDAAASAHRPGRPAALPRQGMRPNWNGPTSNRCPASSPAISATC